MANINEFKSQLIGGGARPNQFRVNLNFPSFVQGGTLAGLRAMFLCKATSLPGSSIENIQTYYRGRPVNFAGERSFGTWSVTIINDATFGIRNAFESWSDGIAGLSDTAGRTSPSSYQADLEVFQLDRNSDVPVKSYKMINAYPTTIGAINLSYESNNAIEEFDVEFVFDYYKTDLLG